MNFSFCLKSVFRHISISRDWFVSNQLVEREKKKSPQNNNNNKKFLKHVAILRNLHGRTHYSQRLVQNKIFFFLIEENKTYMFHLNRKLIWGGLVVFIRVYGRKYSIGCLYLLRDIGLKTCVGRWCECYCWKIAFLDFFWRYFFSLSAVMGQLSLWRSLRQPWWNSKVLWRSTARNL